MAATWKEEIAQAYAALGGRASYANLYDYIERTTTRNLTPEWKATVRRVVETHSSESDNYRLGNEDLFYPVNGIESRSGVWGLKNNPSEGATRKDIEKLIASKEEEEKDSGSFDPSNIQDGRDRILASIVKRRGQPKFRKKLLQIYGGKCAITGANAQQALEAAHIIPYKGNETNHPTNGLLLRADVHTLFDLKLIAIDTNGMTVLVSPSLMSTNYKELAGTHVHLPAAQSDRPSIEALNIHRQGSGL